MFPMFLPAPYS